MSIAPWRTLTSRGWTFLIAGLAVTITAMLFGQTDLVWFGVLLTLLPVVAMVLVARARMSLASERRVTPARVALGDTADVELVLTKRSRWPLGLLRFEEAVPSDLGTRPRFTVHQFGGQWTRELHYPLTGETRGRYTIGPLLVRGTDPFGLARLDRRFAATREVMVTPRIEALSAASSAAGTGHSGESTPQKVGSVGTDDVLVREYRAGDDVRRIHWRSTARRDELMVRREEQAWDPSLTLLLDNRAHAHSGIGRQNSYEWAVSAAASVSLHLIRSGFRVSVFDVAGSLVQTKMQAPGEAREAVLVAMTDSQLEPEVRTFQAMVDAMLREQTGEILMAVTGRLSVADVQAMATMRSHRAQGLAMVLDVDTFTARRLRADGPEADEHDEAVALLRRNAWRVVEVKRGMRVNEAWVSLDRMGANR